MTVKQANFRRKRWVMLTLPGFNLPTIGCLVFVLIHYVIVYTVWSKGDEMANAFYHQYGLSWTGLKEGNVPAFLTHMFLHANGLHVLVNALLFYYAASRLGHVLRSLKVVTLFLACGLLSSLVHVMGQIVFSGLPSFPLVGASGGVMGLYLAVTVLYPDSKMAVIGVSARNVGKGFLVASALLFLMTPGLKVPLFSLVGIWSLSFVGPALFQMGHLLHFFGGLTGMLLVGRMLPALVTLEELQAARRSKEGGAEPAQAEEPS